MPPADDASRRRWWLSRAPFLGIAIAAYTALRIPSFLEPHWYTDEAGYVTTAREMLRGKLLYSDIWSNKPPLQLWTVAGVIHFFGTGEAALHAMTYLSGILTLCAAAYAGFRLLSFPMALIALAALVTLIGTPVLDAELIVPESLLIAPASWAGAILLVRIDSSRAHGHLWPAAVGVLAGLAVAYQQTAAADAMAFLFILLVSPKVTIKQLASYALALAGVTAAWLVPSVALARAPDVGYALAGFYVPYTTYELGGDVPNTALFGVLLCAGTLLAVIGGIAARRGAWLGPAAVWAVATLLAAGAPLHPYPHLALPALVPSVITLAGALQQTVASVRGISNFRWAVASLTGAAVIAGSLAAGTGADWVPPLASKSTNQSRTLMDYYAGFVRDAATTGSLEAWRASFNENVEADRLVAEWLKSSGLAGVKAVVWSSDAWLYTLADLEDVMPTPPIYNNFALLGTQGEVTTFIAGQKPEVIITADSDLEAFPEIARLLNRRYTEAFSASPDHVWLRYHHRPLAQ